MTSKCGAGIAPTYYGSSAFFFSVSAPQLRNPLRGSAGKVSVRHGTSSLPLNIANILEWQSMPFNLLLGKVFLVLLFGFVFLWVAYGFSCRLEEFALFVAGAAMACSHVRFVLLFVPFFAPLLATMLACAGSPRYREAERSLSAECSVDGGYSRSGHLVFPVQWETRNCCRE